MRSHNFEQFGKTLLQEVDVEINGSRPWDIQVHNPLFYKRAISQGSLGLGESYMDGWWDCEALDELVHRLVQGNLAEKIKKKFSAALLWPFLRAYLFPAGQAQKSFEVGERHYNLGNDLFQAMLDQRLVYTCAYWKQATTLDEAQEAKLDLVCRKLQLKAGMRVLDIGGGWGSFAKYAAQNYGVQVVNITVSKEQVALANELCQGLPVENRLMDYRAINEPFDAIVSLGMFEHVGPRYYSEYMSIVERCLKDNGLFLLHTIGLDSTWYETDPWIAKYIFPNSALPSVAQIALAIEKRFVLEDWHNFGADYDTTLMAWYKNFEQHWPQLQNNYDQRFYRMWRFYLLSCAGAFRARSMQLWQLVLSKKGVPGGYHSVR